MEEIPKEWSKSNTCSIYKEGDLMECHNYRGIILLNIAYKVFSNILLRELYCIQKSYLKLSVYISKGLVYCSANVSLRQIMKKLYSSE
jgi:hypothetical protein